MSDWYQSLSVLDTIFLYFATIGGGFLFLKMLLEVIGIGGAEGGLDGLDGVDADVSGTADASFKVFSIQFLASFSMMFGAVGLACSSSGMSAFQAVVGGTLSGVALGYVMERLMRMLLKLQHNGVLKLEELIGQEAKVYSAIPANGTGKITVIFQNRTIELNARNSTGQKFTTGDLVTITDIHGTLAEVAQPL